MSSLPTLRTPRALVAILGGIAVAGVLGTTTAAAGDAATPQIVMIDPSASLTAKVRTEERRGNDVGDTFRAIGKGFVADLDKADIARLNRDPDVLLVEPDRARAIAQALGAAGAHDVVLIAGKGHELYQEVGGQRLAFSDVQQVLLAQPRQTAPVQGHA